VSIVRLPRLSRAVYCVALALSAAAIIAAASGTADAYSDRVRRACKGDFHRLCGQYKAETAQGRACMEANGWSISGPCIDALVDSGEIDGSRVKKRR
jgi:hypothetical protein